MGDVASCSCGKGLQTRTVINTKFCASPDRVGHAKHFPNLKVVKGLHCVSREPPSSLDIRPSTSYGRRTHEFGDPMERGEEVHSIKLYTMPIKQPCDLLSTARSKDLTVELGADPIPFALLWPPSVAKNFSDHTSGCRAAVCKRKSSDSRWNFLHAPAHWVKCCNLLISLQQCHGEPRWRWCRQ